jgi:LacI family transcriptional regulator
MTIKRPTARDVARRAGVSQTTVSLVLNRIPNARISEDVRQRVWEAARGLDYEPNAVAQSLRRRSTHTIGLVIPDITNPHFWQIARGAERRAADLGYSVLLTSTDLGLDRERRALTSLKQQRVDGLILQVQFPITLLREIEAIRAHGQHIVRIGRVSPDLDCIILDYGAGCTELLDHLVALGHRRIGFVFGTTAPDALRPEVELGQERFVAYRQAVERHGLDGDADLVQHCGSYPEHARQATERLLALRPRPTAIIAINDYLAVAVVRTAVEAGLRVPGDLSIAGFDDVPLAQYLSPALTTVRANAEAVGEKAVDLLLARLKDPGLPPQHFLMPTSLVIRESTEVPPN